jgi:hypothetical protein
MVMRFRVYAAVVLGLALFLPDGATAKSWGELECSVIREYISDREDRLASIERDRQVLALALRGTSFEAYERIQDQLASDDVPTKSSGAAGRMMALLNDRCSGI